MNPIVESVKKDDQVTIDDTVTGSIIRMREGTPLIRRIEGPGDDSADVTMCVAFLSDELDCIRFLKHDSASEHLPISHEVKVPDISRVAQSTTDDHSLALLIPSDDVIVEFIFASEEDYSAWYTGMKYLIRSEEGLKSGSDDDNADDHRADTVRSTDEPVERDGDCRVDDELDDDSRDLPRDGNSPASISELFEIISFLSKENQELKLISNNHQNVLNSKNSVSLHSHPYKPRFPV
jgi:hypothetical protein